MSLISNLTRIAQYARTSTKIKFRQSLLLTPGPLMTSSCVKRSMLRDVGSRDPAFLDVVSDVRGRLLAAARVPDPRINGFEAVLVPGSGTYCVEAVLSSAVPRRGAHLLIVCNGAYGRRMADIVHAHRISHTTMHYEEYAAPRAEDVAKVLREHDPPITHVAMVHHETTTGILCPVDAIGQAVRTAASAQGRTIAFIVDSMSGFGAYPIDLRAPSAPDFLISASNKNFESVPGVAFALCRRRHLNESKHARTVSLDLHAQWRGFVEGGQFRFTPPTHAIVAFRQALVEWEAEGGHRGRHARYARNASILRRKMATLGFTPYLDENVQGDIITTFLYPEDPRFEFHHFYDLLVAKGVVIYPGKIARANAFRIGSIGHVFEADMRVAVDAVQAVLREMGVATPVAQESAPTRKDPTFVLNTRHL